MRALAGLLFATAALLVVTGAAGAPRPVPGEREASAAVQLAVRSGRLTRAAAKGYRLEIARAVHLARLLPLGRRKPVEVALEQVGALGKRLTSPRALAVFGQLKANDDYFAQHGTPSGGTDIADADGIVYRYFAGRCFEFHPLANFAALNARVSAKDSLGAMRLAAALEARAISRRGGRIVWQYYFPFGGRAPWMSGMAQAVAAQAFARAASLVTDESASLLREARGAFRAVPGLTTKLSAGPWIRLYSFSADPVLNAQLQSVLSLQTYATATGDTAAATLAAQMEQAAAATVSRFDTGYWTYYSLLGDPSPLSYQQYVVRLLRKLAPADPRFAQAADRFATYLKQPPAFKVANASAGAFRFWLSKPAAVTASTPAGRSIRLTLDRGWHTLHWAVPKRAGFYPISVTAVDYAGNRSSFSALPIVRVPSTGSNAKPARRSSAGGSTTGTPSFAAGVGVDDASQATLAGSLGLQLVRMSVGWHLGETAPDPAVVASLQSLPTGASLALELSTAQLPADASARTELTEFAASLAKQTPSLRDLVLTPAPSLADAAAYADALAAVRAAVVEARPDVRVGPLLDGSTAQPQRTALAFAQELGHDGSRADLVFFRPAPAPEAGAWGTDDLVDLETALAKASGAAPPLLVNAVATSTTVPPAELGSYTGGTPPTEGSTSPATQASAYAAAIEAASCSPNVDGVLLDRLVDYGAAPESTTGLFYASGDPKPSAAAVKEAIRTVARGAAVCPGLARRVTASTLTFPQQLSGSSASVALTCNHDCLYLVTLDHANGRPVVASSGTLNGGDPATSITLPKRRLRPGGYRLDVRLVSRVDPGAVTRRLSPLLTVG